MRIYIFFFFEILLFGIYLYKNLNMTDIERKKEKEIKYRSQVQNKKKPYFIIIVYYVK